MGDITGDIKVPHSKMTKTCRETLVTCLRNVSLACTEWLAGSFRLLPELVDDFNLY